jgi:hypothetical protein
MAKGEFGQVWHEKQLNTVDNEIARLAAICDIRMLDPGVIERVINGDDSVCGRSNEKAFKQLRSLVGLHYSLTADSIQAIGPEESRKILDRIRERIGQRYDIGGAE